MSLELDLRALIRDHAVLIVLSALAVAIVAAGVSFVLPGTYAATSQVTVSSSNPIGATLSLPSEYPSDQTGLLTQVGLVTRRENLESVVASLGLDISPKSLGRRVEARQEGLSSNISIEVRDKEAERAAILANAIARQFVEWSMAQRKSALDAAIASVGSRMRAVESEIATLETSRAAGSSTSQRLRPLALASARARYQELSDKLELLRVSRGIEVSPVSVTEEASSDAERVGPRPLIAALLGLLTGAIAAVAIVWVRERNQA